MNDAYQQLTNYALQAGSLTLAYASPPLNKIISGTPRVGAAVLGTLGSCQIGVWEISPSVTRDIEVDEFFIVLSGAAMVSFDDGSPAMLLKAGSVGRLTQGTATTWTVTETLRKIYVA
jgi:uncharacterized cupin superfamily protein